MNEKFKFHQVFKLPQKVKFGFSLQLSNPKSLMPKTALQTAPQTPFFMVKFGEIWSPAKPLRTTTRSLGLFLPLFTSLNLS